jgi:dephospho-CoA kinase
MILIGLTGGIASGKSTVARLLESKGALVIDADKIGHEVMASGGPAFDQVIERFGRDILTADGEIDRAKLGPIVFADEKALADHTALTHPHIVGEIVKRIDAERAGDRVVVVDAALLVEGLAKDRGKALGLDALVVVSTNVEEQIRRMIDERGMEEPAAKARIGSQAPPEKKLAAADYVIDNRGSIDDLRESVDLLWEDLERRFGE